MRFIARSYKELGFIEEARMWLDKAIEEAPYLRDPYMERALLEYSEDNLEAVYFYCKKALEIKSHTKTYIHEVFSWDETVYDLLSISAFYLGYLDEALEYVTIACDMNPNDERLLSNKDIIMRKKEAI
jgi:tetratricopeptide (TPR) repeat protein